MLTPLHLVCTVTLATLAGGCGTFVNTLWFTPDEGGKRAYGGVRADVQYVRQTATEPAEHETVLGRAGKATLMALDVPFSLVGDTVLLPVNLWQQWEDR